MIYACITACRGVIEATCCVLMAVLLFGFAVMGRWLSQAGRLLEEYVQEAQGYIANGAAFLWCEGKLSMHNQAKLEVHPWVGHFSSFRRWFSYWFAVAFVSRR